MQTFQFKCYSNEKDIDSTQKNKKIQNLLVKKTNNPVSGKWTYKEIQCYIQFLRENKLVLEDFKSRREKKVFKLMSNIIKTRTSDQCRSHHQKVQKLHQTTEEIIEFYGNKLKNQQAQIRSQNICKLTKNIVLKSGQFLQDKFTAQNQHAHRNKVMSFQKQKLQYKIKEKLFIHENQLINQKNQLFNYNNQLVNQNNQLVEQNNQSIDQNNQLNGQNNQLVGQNNQQNINLNNHYINQNNMQKARNNMQIARNFDSKIVNNQFQNGQDPKMSQAHTLTINIPVHIIQKYI